MECHRQDRRRGWKTRRWVYLHVFKPGQPVRNWMDPSCTAQRAIAADVVRSIFDLGAKVVRLDAVPFLGIEPQERAPTALYYQHPLSALDTQYLAFSVRRLGGWSFQELNVPFAALQHYLRAGRIWRMTSSPAPNACMRCSPGTQRCCGWLLAPARR